MQRLPLKLVNNTVLATTAGVLYTSPFGTKTTISALTFTNSSTSVATMTVYIVPAAGSLGQGNLVISARQLAIGESYIATPVIGQTLEAGDTLQAFASAGTAISVTASGYSTVS